MKKKMSQASLDNLKKGTPWTTERAKRYARYGQKKSVETKKRNKAMAEFAKIVADTEITNEDMLRMLADLGISDPSVQNTLKSSSFCRSCFICSIWYSITPSGRTVRFLSEIYLFSVNYPSPKGNGLVTAQPS